MDLVLEVIKEPTVTDWLATTAIGYVAWKAKNWGNRLRDLEQTVKNGLRSKVEDLHEEVYQ